MPDQKTGGSSAAAGGDRPHEADPSAPPEKGAPDAHRCLVVMYHYVRERDPLASPAAPHAGGVRGLTPQTFRNQLDQLATALEPVTWPQLVAWRAGRGTVPERSFLLTFDDGLADHVRAVAPILEQRGMRGVFLAAGSVLTGQRMLPAHAIHLLLSALGEERLCEEMVRVLTERGEIEAARRLQPERLAAAGCPAMYGYESAFRGCLKHALTMELDATARNAALETLFELHVGSVARWSRHWYAGWDDLVALQARGHTIGGHGYSHEPYTRMSPAEQSRDAWMSAAVLSEGLGPDLRPISFPYGRYDAGALRACREAGFVQAFTTESRWLTADDESLCLPRVDTIHVAAVLEEEMSCTPG